MDDNDYVRLDNYASIIENTLLNSCDCEDEDIIYICNTIKERIGGSDNE